MRDFVRSASKHPCLISQFLHTILARSLHRFRQAGNLCILVQHHQNFTNRDGLQVGQEHVQEAVLPMQ